MTFFLGDRLPADSSARTASHRRGAVRAAAVVLLFLLAFVTGCSSPEDPVSTSGGNSIAIATPESVADAPAPASAPTVLQSAGSVPVRISIDTIGVDSDLMGLGLQPDGTMEVPPGGFPAGWYDGSPVPGALGPSIVAGHVDWDGSPGVFYRLDDMSVGDSVVITDSAGEQVTFAVTSVEQYPKDAFPTEAVYGDIDHAGLRLITCGGQFDSGAASYDDNIVVYAARV